MMVHNEGHTEAAYADMPCGDPSQACDARGPIPTGQNCADTGANKCGETPTNTTVTFTKGEFVTKATEAVAICMEKVTGHGGSAGSAISVMLAGTLVMNEITRQIFGGEK